MKGLRLPSYAKINLGLEVLSRREDGYHELRTIFQTIDLCDTVTLAPRPRGITLSCDQPGVPLGEENLAVQAAEQLLRFASVRKGVSIHLEKRIPMGGGLGGGSSNAAAVLLGLNHLWGLRLHPSLLHPLARRLGADVPFFLVGGTALGLARGDEVYPLHLQVRGEVVLVDPGRPVSTARVFARIDESLTPRENSNTIFRFVSRDLEGEGFRLLSNDLERASFEEAPELGRTAGDIRGVLERGGACLAALSGSGSTFFGLFRDAGRARRAVGALRASGHRTLRARTLSLQQYRRRWSAALVVRSYRGRDL